MRTKRWLLVGTVLPALVLSQASQALAPLGTQLAQASGGDDDRGRGPRERPHGPPGAQPGQHAPQRPTPPGAPQGPRPPQMQHAPAAPHPPMPAAPAPAERAAGSSWLAEAGGERLPIDRIAVGSGAQALLTAVLLSQTREGDAILTDALTYPGLIALAGAAKRRLVAVRRDVDGMLPDDLDEATRREGARLVYINPTLHNPTAMIMPEGRRRDLARVVDRLGMTIVEDDPYSRLLALPPTSFLDIAPGRTVHIATMAKCISPFLRTAFLAGPDAATVARIAEAIRGTTMMAPPLMTGLACEWVRSGLAGEIALAVREEALARQEIASAILPDVVAAGQEGLHAWLRLGDGQRSADIADIARRRGLALSPAEEFAVGLRTENALRVSLGAAPGRDRLREGLRGLAAILAERGGSSAPVV